VTSRISTRVVERSEPLTFGSVASAAARGGRIDKSTHGSALATLEDLYAQHALRGYDAVHLACALQLHGDDILHATCDNALNAGARTTRRLRANDTRREPIESLVDAAKNVARKSNRAAPSA
jgi:hypothetical protein